MSQEHQSMIGKFLIGLLIGAFIFAALGLRMYAFFAMAAIVALLFIRLAYPVKEVTVEEAKQKLFGTKGE